MESHSLTTPTAELLYLGCVCLPVRVRPAEVCGRVYVRAIVPRIHFLGNMLLYKLVTLISFKLSLVSIG